MKKKEINILAYLVEIYKDFYTHKDLFKMNFKYSLDDVECFYKQIKNSFDTNNTSDSDVKELISDDILNLKTRDDVKEYIVKFRSNSNQPKDDLLKKLSLNEFAYIYNIIYTCPIKPNMRKIDVLNAIEKYFNGISRAESMKP